MNLKLVQVKKEHDETERAKDQKKVNPERTAESQIVTVNLIRS